jgi:hypothetical protein
MSTWLDALDRRPGVRPQVMLQAPASNAAPSLGKLTGTWKENESKRKLGPLVTLKFRRDAQGNLEELRGNEARPLVQPVHFDGKPYSVDSSKNTIVWRQIDKISANDPASGLRRRARLRTLRARIFPATAATIKEHLALTRELTARCEDACFCVPRA